MKGKLFACLTVVFLGLIAVSWAKPQSSAPQDQKPANDSPANSRPTNQPPDAGQDDSSQADSSSTSHSTAGTSSKPRTPDFSPPRSDRVNASDLGNDVGESSSKDEPVDLSPPADDAKAHPKSSEALTNAEAELSGGVTEFHQWDPHKAAKSVEVGDFYFKRKNYRAAEDRYREALMFKDNDAIATLRLAVCLEKMARPGEAILEYESYLKILPNGPESEQAHKAIARLNQAAASAK